MPRKPTGRPAGRPPVAGAARTELLKVRLTPDELAALDALAAERGTSPAELVRAWIALARGGVLRPAEAAPTAPEAPAPAGEPAPPMDAVALAEAVLEHVRADAARSGVGLASIAAVVRLLLAAGHELAAVHAALATLAAEHALELRPTAGDEFKAPGEELCPPGPRGTVLGYARPL